MGQAANSTGSCVGSRVRMHRKILDMNQEKLGEQLAINFQGAYHAD